MKYSSARVVTIKRYRAVDRRVTTALVVSAILLFSATPRPAVALTVTEVRYASQATLKVYQVRYPSQADLKIQWVDRASQAKGDAFWFRTRYPSQAERKVYFVRYPSQADIKIYVVEHSSQAGWNGPPRGLQSGR
ncbi:MAG: DUF6150 family protein [Dokdonella sp.]